MADPTALIVPDPAPTAAPMRRGWRVSQLFFAPFRFVRRRPKRALWLVSMSLVFLVASTFLSIHLWFRYHLHAAEKDVAAGHNAAAAKHLKSCHTIRPTHPEVMLLMARVARRSGAWAEADELLDRSWEVNGESEEFVFERLLLRATRGEIEAVGPALAVRIANGGPEAQLGREAIITGLLYRYRWIEANDALDAWLKLEPDNTAALLLRGKLNDQRSHSSESLLNFKRIVELDPEHDEARLRLTTVLLQVSQGPEAIPHLEYLRHRLPDLADVKVQLVRALVLAERHDEARRQLAECLAEHPMHPGALLEKGKQAFEDRDDATAEEALTLAKRLDPGNLSIRHLLVKALVRQGKTAAATREQNAVQELEADFEKIGVLIQGKLQATPNDPAVHHEIARIALRAGQPDDALRWLNTAIQVDPNHLPSHQLLAAYYHEIGNPILSARHRAFAQQLNPKVRP